MSTYEPSPIDTTHVQLVPELEQSIERIAASVHDRWAMQRLAEGWRWGPERDDVARTHPNLVAYEDLTDAERAYDRICVRATLTAAVALGYRISPP